MFILSLLIYFAGVILFSSILLIANWKYKWITTKGEGDVEIGDVLIAVTAWPLSLPLAIIISIYIAIIMLINKFLLPK